MVMIFGAPSTSHVGYFWREQGTDSGRSTLTVLAMITSVTPVFGDRRQELGNHHLNDLTV
jgi:hypothetical protein